jgi:lipopolysaccharide transport system ATP-binding protein
MSDIAVKLENISKFYKLYNEPKDRLKEALHPFGKKFHKKFYALNDINLEIKKGEILGIVGRNGAGKSTLLKLISGVIQPSSGAVSVRGAVSALLELGSGLNPEFTGIQNIYFYGTILGFAREEMKEKIDEIVAFADIGGFIQQPLKTYSSGMKARLGFSLAVNIDPEILIVDEVLAVGDELFRRKCYAKMEGLFNSGCTVLFVSHSSGTVNEICSRAILLDKGELILEGAPKLVTIHYQKYLFARAENAAKIRNEIIQLNTNENKKKDFVESMGKGEKKKENEKKETNNTEGKKEEIKQEPFFIPNLKPKSTVEYKNYDVDIYDVHIRTLDGKRVNALVMDEEYIYSYKVRFNIGCENVSFGMKFKTEKGLQITGATSMKMNQDVPRVTKGEEYLVNWRFKCSLLPSNYYTNAGVSSTKNGTVEFLNRIIDASTFRVQPVPRELVSKEIYYGLVNLCQTSNIQKLN